MKKTYARFLINSIYVVILTATLTACYSSAVMQTAATLEKGKHQMNISSGITMDTFTMGRVPMFGFHYRYGVGQSDEVQFFAAYTGMLHGRLEWKHRLYSSEDSFFMVSGGLAFEGFYEPVDLTRFDFFPGASLPIYVSLWNSNKVSLYGHTRFATHFENASLLFGAGQYTIDDFPEIGTTNVITNTSYWTNSIGARIRGSERIFGYAELGLSTFISRQVGGDYFEKKKSSGNFSTVTYDYEFVNRTQLLPLLQFNVGLSIRLN